MCIRDSGTSMCCSRIRVTLNGVVKDKQGGYAGTYQKASGLINNRSHWIDGNQALWYNIITNVWEIADSSQLGANANNSIHSVQDTACPTSDNLFRYYDVDADKWLLHNKWLLAPINSVSIQCV